MAMTKPSEDTVTTILQGMLVESGLNVQAFPIWETPVGIRKPDLLCLNSGFYPLEAKLKEKDIIKDIVKVQNDYLKYSKLLNIEGAFVLKYPESLKTVTKEDLYKKVKESNCKLILMFPEGDSRQFEILNGKISELIPIIIETVKYQRIKQELDPEIVIQILREAAKQLDEALKSVKMDLLVNKMGGVELFQDLLSINVKKELKSIRLAVSFFILTQLLFYHVIASFPEHNLRPLDEIKKLEKLNELYFNKIMEINYRAIFSMDIVSHLPHEIEPHINRIIIALKGLKPEKVKGDLLGTIFHDLIPFEIRKRVAAYYTNILATDLLANLVIEDKDECIADLACGSGGLLVAAYRRKKQLLEDEQSFSENDHKKFINEDIIGVDIMPFATNIASCNLALQSPQYVTNKVNIGLWDATDLQPGDVIPEFASLSFVFRAKTLDTFFDTKEVRRTPILVDEAERKNGIHLDTFDTILMNPPFTRQERLPPDYKNILDIRFKEYKEIYNNVMSFHGIFMLLGDKFLREGGKMGLVLPASILARKSFEKLREFICQGYKIEWIIYNTSRLSFSESTLFREILLIIKKENPRNHHVKICRLTRYPDSQEKVKRISETIKNQVNSENYRISVVEQESLMKIKDWSNLVILSPLLHMIFDQIENHPLMCSQ